MMNVAAPFGSLKKRNATQSSAGGYTAISGQHPLAVRVIVSNRQASEQTSTTYG
ncbi:hypothetical protein NEUTE2DRAFT_169553 [Neurospora tetrasperma FGSC 2509]|nr:hypothetical protein NEUTE2DRAFT_169553 [Neurospora tetrasperma FGSC 2509]